MNIILLTLILVFRFTVKSGKTVVVYVKWLHILWMLTTIFIPNWPRVYVTTTFIFYNVSETCYETVKEFYNFIFNSIGIQE